jgi:hypothetical protein
MCFLCVILTILIIIIIYRNRATEGLVNKPTNDDVEKYTNDIISNRPIFGGSFYAAREKLPWIDPILYEDARILSKQNNFTREAITQIFQ